MGWGDTASRPGRERKRPSIPQAGSRMGRNLRNPVDSSILVIMHCGGEKTQTNDTGRVRAAQSIAPCLLPCPRPNLPLPPTFPGGLGSAPFQWQLRRCPAATDATATQVAVGPGLPGEAESDGGTSSGEAECGCQRLPGSGSSRPPTCREVCVLLEVGYDEVAEDVEADEEQGADLQAEVHGQCRQARRAAAPTLGDATGPGAHQPHPIYFSTPGPGYTPHTYLALPVHGGCTQDSPTSAHKLPQHPGQRNPGGLRPRGEPTRQLWVGLCWQSWRFDPVGHPSTP